MVQLLQVCDEFVHDLESGFVLSGSIEVSETNVMVTYFRLEFECDLALSVLRGSIKKDNLG